MKQPNSQNEIANKALQVTAHKAPNLNADVRRAERKEMIMKRTASYIALFVIAVLMESLFSGCVASHTNIATSPFVGQWCNKDFNTRGITRVHITQVGNGLKVHMWGRCHPTECDWGEVTGTLDEGGRVIAVTWDQSFVVRTQKFQIKPDGALAVTTHSHYTDNSGRADRDETDLFVKGLVHDWSDRGAE